MKRLAITFTLIVFSSASIFADDLRRRAEENPLDYAVYLVSKDRLLRDGVYSTLFEVGRYNDLLKALESEPHSRVRWLGHFSAEFIDLNKETEANQFLDKAIELFRSGDESWSDDHVNILVKSLIALNRSDEAFEIWNHQEYENDRAEISVEIARAYLKIGQNEKAIRSLSQTPILLESFSEIHNTIDVADLFIKVGQKETASGLLGRLEKSPAVLASTNRDSFLLRMVPLYIRLGQFDKAFDVWNHDTGVDDPDYLFSYASTLFTNGRADQADPFLTQLRTDKEYMDQHGDSMVDMYLGSGDIETARSIALTMSQDNDNYGQQRALMAIADRMIELGSSAGALELTEIAFRRAQKVGEQHDPMDSIGASSLSRKIIYLGAIRKCYFKLGMFEKGLTAAQTLKTDHWLAREFRVESLLDFVVHNRTLHAKRGARLIKEAMNICGDDEDGCRITAGLGAAGYYARVGEQTAAVDTLTDVLAFIHERTYLNSSIPAVGEVFEKNKLRANARLQRLLKEMVKEAD